MTSVVMTGTESHLDAHTEALIQYKVDLMYLKRETKTTEQVVSTLIQRANRI